MALETKKAKTGWMIKHNPDELWQGALVGQKYLYKTETLAALGISYNESPEARANKYGATNAEIAWIGAVPDKIIRKGWRVG
ncbi:MAG: hypothetical protein ACOCR8_00180 [Desulfosalsimonas sp.]